MSKSAFSISALAATLFIAPAFAVDGTILINQSTVMAAGGFPYHIAQTGSYRLSGNLIATSTGAIVISASNVTLDLNGFTIACVACSGVSGISSSGIVTVIMNGTVDGFQGTGGNGISFQGAAAKADHMTINGNTTGILTTGPDLTVIFSNVSNNSFDGISGSGSNLNVNHSVISANGQDGIDILNGLVTENTIIGNGFSGTFTRGGIILFGGTVNITNNMIANSAGFGIGILGLGTAGVGSNTFGGNTTDFTASSRIVSMHNNACAFGVC
jgi:hypothetical protein